MKRTILSTAIALAFSFNGMAFAANTASVTQNGDSNYAMVHQDASATTASATVIQNGSHYDADIYQINCGAPGADCGTAVINGSGTSGYQGTSQNGAAGSTATITGGTNTMQDTATINQNGATNSHATITQTNLSAVGPGVEGQNVALITQATGGDNLTATITQDAAQSSLVTITQNLGNNNIASVSQTGTIGDGFNPNALITQTGVGHQAIIDQKDIWGVLSPFNATITQLDVGNQATINQWNGSDNAIATITQSGTSQVASITQDFSSGVNASINQSGGSNGASIVQRNQSDITNPATLATTITQTGTNQLASILQDYSLNASATITQSGSNSPGASLKNLSLSPTIDLVNFPNGAPIGAFITQTAMSDGASASILQIGNDNSATIDQMGASNSHADITQNGNYNIASISQSGPSNTALIDQLGSNLSAKITQSGSGAMVPNSATILQTGYPVLQVASIAQSVGGGNTALITQGR